MARKAEPERGGYPVFWLLLGFLCGVMATLGVLLLSSGPPGEGRPATAPDASIPIKPPALVGAPPLDGAAPITPPPSVEPATPIQEPVVRPTLPTFRPDSQDAPAVAAPRSAPAPGRSAADQMAEDVAASGLTARMR
jgi:hypothetical protein